MNGPLTMTQSAVLSLDRGPQQDQSDQKGASCALCNKILVLIQEANAIGIQLKQLQEESRNRSAVLYATEHLDFFEEEF